MDKFTTLWTKGDPRFGDFVQVQKTSLIGEWEVQARRPINPKTIDGHFRFFKSKAQAERFARNYRRIN